MYLTAFVKLQLRQELPFAKTLRIMKLLTLFLLAFCLQVSANSYAQKVTLSGKNLSLEKIFRMIERQTDYVFFFDEDGLQRAKTVTIDVKKATLTEALILCFNNQPLGYSIVGNTIVVSNKQVPPEIKKAEELAPPPPIEIKGRVTDADGNPMEGVSVIVKGTLSGVTTDANGNYTISVPENSSKVLVFSFVGMENQEISVKANATLPVVLKAAVNQQQEVVVVGYSSQSKRKLTSAVATVSGEELNERVATNPVTLMQGKLPGLQVVQGSGEPGNEGMQLRIRGITTFSQAGNEPLVIVNGIPGSLSALNPNDIESISVLKDAALTAMYGARGSNGVIVVTTKKGKSGFALQYNFNLGISSTAQLPETVTNSAEFMELSNEARTNSGLQPLYTQEQIDLYRNATDRVKYPNHNWLEDVFVTAYTKNHFLNLSGGANGTTYNIGFGITDQPGTMIGFEYKKYTASIGISSKLNKRVTIGTDIQMRYGNRKAPRSGGGDIFLSTLAQSPLYPPRTEDGRWIKKAYSNELNNKNPVAIAAEDVRIQTLDYYAQGNLSVDVEIIDGLKWENRGGATFYAMKNSDFRPIIPMYYYSDMSTAGTLDVGSPGLSVRRQDNIYGILYSQLNFKRKFGEHSIGALAGAQQEYNTFSFVSASRNAFPTNLIRELNGGPADGQSNSGSSSEWAIRSFYGNVNYDFRDRYLFGASIRRDGTSRLPADTRWGTFYSLSAAWRLSEESFLQNVSWINDLKLRGSWGVVGNQNIITTSDADLSVYPYQPTLDLRNYAFGGAVQPGFSAGTLVDPTLVWETTRVLDIGFDLTALNNRLTFTADWFDKYTYDILRPSQVPLWLGLGAPIINNGTLRNRGVEFLIGYRDNISKDFSYDVSANFQTYKNKLVDYGSRDIGGNSIREEGKALDEFYMYVWDGIFQSQQEIDNAPAHPVTPTPGDIRIKDVNGDKVITPDDRTYVKGRYPTFQYSFNLGLKWKGFDFAAQLYGSQGQKIYVNGWGAEPFRQGSVPTTDWRNRWTPTNPSTTMPKIYVADGYAPIQNYASTYFLKDASFMRLRAIQLGYSFAPNIINKVGAKSLRIYFVGDNVFTISKFPGLDPERTSSSGTYVTFPQIKTFTFGASVQF
ncbi:MAG: TonB-dependent receptor [Agriterribacter sp.]